LISKDACGAIKEFERTKSKYYIYNGIFFIKEK